MRILVQRPLGQLDVIADHFPYTGCFEDDNDFLSDISFYDHGGNSTEEEMDDCNDNPLKKKVDNLPKSAMKLGKSRIQRFEQIKVGACVELKKNIREELHAISKQKKPPKQLMDRASSLVDFEYGEIMQKNQNFVKPTSKKEEIGRHCTVLYSGCRDENTRDSNVKKGRLLKNLFENKSDAAVRVDKVQASQRRKKLCKGADLNSLYGKGLEGKYNRNLLDNKGKTGKKDKSNAKDRIAVDGIHVNELDDDNSDIEAGSKFSARESVKKAMMENMLYKKDGRLESAEVSREAHVVRKSLLKTGHARSHRDIKHKDITGIPHGVHDKSNQHPIPALRRFAEKSCQEIKNLCNSPETLRIAVDYQRRAFDKAYDHGVAGEEVSSGVTEGAEENKEQVPGEYGNSKANIVNPNLGWVMCDSCKKWRSIPAWLVDVIESTNCGWFCKDNPDKKFAVCSIPQEKTNIEINRELNLSEVSVCEEGDEESPAIDSKLRNGMDHQCHLSTWRLIKHNIYRHRSRKSETLDEQMVCTCKPPGDGSPGCGDDCHNRMLNIECVAQTCPCGDACSNQQFQKRLYKRVKWFRCGKKGFGLQVLEDVPKGAFIIEYVGEVLDMATYEARQNNYALEGQKHFYFMQLSGSEVIDACYKGNLGRFINHSCDPNCTTEKWMVNGEVCIGLFAKTNLKKGEEITFDYKFVRLCGAAAKKCLCGSQDCRGFIGRDPTTPQSVVPSDSDEDDPEPIMIKESSEDESQIDDSKSITPRNETDSVEANSSSPFFSKEKTWMHAETSEKQGAGFKQVKTKSSTKTAAAANVKKLSSESDGEHFEGVEEKLNKLVDERGGLCKGEHEVATRYLKLLVLTAFSSSDTSNGEGSRSTRDLSLVLDALLKTQSRAIILEVLSKNGFQVMHKIVKQSRMDYKKTPIIRKILKVLEFLAVKRVLTIDRMNAEPARSGAESIKDAIFQLCRHADTEVQSMARHLVEKYLKKDSQKPLKRGQQPPSDLSKWQLFRNQNQQSSLRALGASEDEATRKCKKPKKWDQPSQEVLDATLTGGLPPSFWPFNANNLPIGGNQKSNGSDQYPRQQAETAAVDELGSMHPGPPSFPAPVNDAEAVYRPLGVVSGVPAEQFPSRSSMDFISPQASICIGIPVSQFQSAVAPKLDIPYRPPLSTSANQTANQASQPSFSSSMDAQELQHDQLGIEPKVIGGEEPKVNFGISHSQFFQQMRDIFGSAFHPWQLQALMAPHAWGPFLSGDIRIKDLGFSNDYSIGHRQPNEYHTSQRSSGIPEQSFTVEYNRPDPELLVPGLSPPVRPPRQPNEYHNSQHSSYIPVEQSLTVEYRQDSEPPVPGLSPPLRPPPPTQPFGHASQPMPGAKCTRDHPSYTCNNSYKRSKMPYLLTKANCMKPQKWNSSRFSRVLGNNKHRNMGAQRNFGHMQRFNAHNPVRHGGPYPRGNFQDSSFERRTDGNWKSFDGRGISGGESMEPAGGRTLKGSYALSLQGSECPIGTVPLERPWGYNQDYKNGDAGNCSEEFVQDRANDTSNSWAVHYN